MADRKEIIKILTNSTSEPENDAAIKSAELVRCMAAIIVVIVLKFNMISLVLWLMHDINHESRAAPIMLNDLMTQFDQVIHEDLDHAVNIVI